MSNEDKKQLKIERLFDVSIEKVWDAWTNVSIVKKWWGPKDFTAPEINIDFREGGKYLYCMRGKVTPESPEQDFWSGGIFRKIIPGSKIILTDNFTDDKGNIVPASFYGMKGDFPLEMEVIVDFEDVNGKTKFTLTYPNLGNINSTDLEGMKEGWNQSLDKFAVVLK
jgi:uncharacterized protein YndB with AHSA1/START domain